MRKGILHLPAELLLEILENCDLHTNDLYQVSLTSRQLNHLALPIFLLRNGIADPETSIVLRRVIWDRRASAVTSEPIDSLSGLKMATYLKGKAIKDLTCYFQYPNSTCNIRQSPNSLHLAVRRLSGFIQGLRSVGVMRLYLISDRRYLRRDHVLRDPAYMLRVWTASFEELLNLTVAKGCTSLTVQYESNSEGSDVYKFRTKSPLSNPFSRVLASVRGVNEVEKAVSLSGTWWEFTTPDHRNTQVPILPTCETQICSIHKLHIHSTSLLSPPFLPWTLQLLCQSTHLTSLSLAHLTFTNDMWQALLPPIASAAGSKLTEFSILESCWSLSTSDLLRFICRLPFLIRLSIDRAFQVRIESDQGYFSRDLYPIPELKHLRVLEAPEEIVLHFLKERTSRFINPPNRVIAMPQLRSLLVYPSTLLADVVSYENSINNWTHLFDRLNDLNRLYKISFGLDVQADCYATNYSGMSSYLNWRGLHTEQGEDVLPVFSKISEVVLHYFDIRDPDHDPDILCRWLHLLFPDLFQVKFTCILATLPVEVIVMPQPTISALTRVFSATCPNVKNLVVAQRKFEMVDDAWIEF
ncbi:hypothetical protein B0H34DRAFT_727609 [Crassisporium funariophilum]|nr:hypothetical protein B0H34DRAFT_727609 [Crassisporium funariophilum]